MINNLQRNSTIWEMFDCHHLSRRCWYLYGSIWYTDTFSNSQTLVMPGMYYENMQLIWRNVAYDVSSVYITFSTSDIKISFDQIPRLLY